LVDTALPHQQNLPRVAPHLLVFVAHDHDDIDDIDDESQ
jgi:hypothetical protein